MAWRVAADCGANKIAEARRARSRQLKTSGFEISRLHRNEISCMRENLVWRTFSSGPFRKLDRNTEPCTGFNIHQARIEITANWRKLPCSFRWLECSLWVTDVNSVRGFAA